MKWKLTMAQDFVALKWLLAVPIWAKEFRLNKQKSTDALALRYGWMVKDPQKFVHCGKNFDEHHAISCHKEGFISIWHKI